MAVGLAMIILLRKQFPLIDGLQSSLLCQNDGFVPIQGEGMYKHSTILLHITTNNNVIIYFIRYPNSSYRR